MAERGSSGSQEICAIPAQILFASFVPRFLPQFSFPVYLVATLVTLTLLFASGVRAEAPRCIAKQPTYPTFQRHAWISGTAVVAISVTSDGSVLRTELRASSGDRVLDEIALDAAADARWLPGPAATFTQAYQFKLIPPTYDTPRSADTGLANG